MRLVAHVQSCRHMEASSRFRLSSSNACERLRPHLPQYYLSPEICTSQPYNHKSDVWGLGCLIYELAAQKRPFEASSITSLVRRILRGKMDPLPAIYSTSMHDLVAALLQQRPSSRPSVAQLLGLPMMRRHLDRMIARYGAHNIPYLELVLPSPVPSLSDPAILRSAAAPPVTASLPPPAAVAPSPQVRPSPAAASAAPAAIPASRSSPAPKSIAHPVVAHPIMGDVAAPGAGAHDAGGRGLVRVAAEADAPTSHLRWQGRQSGLPVTSAPLAGAGAGSRPASLSRHSPAAPPASNRDGVAAYCAVLRDVNFIAPSRLLAHAASATAASDDKGPAPQSSATDHLLGEPSVPVVATSGVQVTAAAVTTRQARVALSAAVPAPTAPSADVGLVLAVESLREMLSCGDSDGAPVLPVVLAKASFADASWEDWYDRGRAIFAAQWRTRGPATSEVRGDTFSDALARWVGAVKADDSAAAAAWIRPGDDVPPHGASGCGRLPLACGAAPVAGVTPRLRLCDACSRSHARLLFHLLVGEAMAYAGVRV